MPLSIGPRNGTATVMVTCLRARFCKLLQLLEQLDRTATVKQRLPTFSKLLRKRILWRTAGPKLKSCISAQAEYSLLPARC
jgi:hypothetical protein